MTTARPDDPVDAEVVEPLGAQVVQLHKNLAPAAPPALEPAREPASRAYQLVKQAARPLPHPKRMCRAAGYWARTLAQVLPWLPVIAARELWPIGRGLRKVLSGFAYWVTATGRKRAAREGEPSKKTSVLATSAEKAATARTIITVILGPAVAGGLVWAWNEHPAWVIGASIVTAALLDLLGRVGEPSVDLPPPMPQVLNESVPLSQITASLLAALEREGFPPGSVGVAEPMWADVTRHQHEISLSLADQLKPEHLRALERAIGAKDYSIRNLATGTATIRKLIIQLGDPLAGGQECEWIPTGSLSFRDPLPLGRSGGETPMAVRFVGAHAALVGRTRSGKTEGLLWTLIDRLAACHDVVLWGIDLQSGPAFPLWRQVIQRVAYTPEDAMTLLATAITEMERRKKILTALAESDDEDDEDAGTVWTADLGPYLVIIIDEFALAATFNGEKGRADLMSPLEVIIRTGLKFGVHLVLATQKTGNSDFGSSTMQTQIGIKFLLSCEERDTTTMLSTEARDSGWSPHLLRPAQDLDPADAGKCYISGPGHTTPDIYRSDYWPKGSVKPRARARLADGLPALDGARATGAVDAVEVPLVPAAVARAFAECDTDRLPTSALITYLAGQGIEVTDQKLSDAMRIGDERIGDRWRDIPGGPLIRGYTRSAVERHIRSLG